MSEENTQATTETVSESPAKETAQPSPNDQYIAESKKYRKRAQDAEARLAELEKKFTQQEESKLKEKEEFKTLYEKASSQVESLTANSEKWTKYEETRRGKLLESHPEEDRESLSKLDLDTLEYVTSKINNIKPNAPEVVGNARNVIPDKPVDWQNKQSLKENWSNIVGQYTKKRKGARK
jgi:transketolase|tara:strand:- start:60 stop:599 length:540 start_codon:yes stop_codon:yes gene_type:complete